MNELLNRRVRARSKVDGADAKGTTRKVPIDTEGRIIALNPPAGLHVIAWKNGAVTQWTADEIAQHAVLLPVRPVQLARIVLLVAYERDEHPEFSTGLEAIADGLADQLRADDGVLTVESDMDNCWDETLDPDDTDAVSDALRRQWPELSFDQRAMLCEAIDSHIYWQLSDPDYRNNGAVIEPGSGDENAAEQIELFQGLSAKLAAPVQTYVQLNPDLL